MKSKKVFFILCAAALMLSLVACGKETTENGSGQTLTGQVTAIDGSNVTLQLGELSQERQAPQEKPNGGTSDGGNTPPEMPSDMENISNFIAGDETVTLDFSAAVLTENGESKNLDSLAVGDVMTVTVGSGTIVSTAEILRVDGGQEGPGGNGFGGSSTVTQGDSANTIAEDGTYTGKTYISTGDDENALRIDGATVTLDGITVNKSAGATSNTENGDFYGVNAALLATNGATVTIKNAAITSSAQNGNGVFSYGSGTTVYISDSTITTTADNSGGI